MPDPLTKLLRAILPKATAQEVAEAAERLGSLLETGATWVGDTAGETVRKVENVLSGGDVTPRAAPALPHTVEDLLWVKVTRALAPRVSEIRVRARVLREEPDAREDVVALARDVDWLVGELGSAWAREVALRAARMETPPMPPTP
ncbi:MAG TPA: hypothetical protein VE091_05295 [Gemmatimonadales bacterium]|nr:hypothetical protein [Gemmatimonadales bacterium]